MVVFSFVGYFMNKYKLPQSPLILAMVLGSMMEKYYLQSMVLSGNSWSIFVTRPICLVLLIISVLFVGVPLYKRYIAKPVKAKA